MTSERDYKDIKKVKHEKIVDYNSSDDDYKDFKRNYSSSPIPCDYYCVLCSMQMNSDLTWEMHVNGKKHQKKVQSLHFGTQRRTGAAPPNTISIQVPGGSQIAAKRTSEIATIQQTFDNVDEPLVGLDFIDEIWLKDESAEPIYYCNLCLASCQRITIIDHVIGYRHRLKYLSLKDEDKYKIFSSSTQKKSKLSERLFVEVQRLEKLYGRGYAKTSVQVSDLLEHFDDLTVKDMDLSGISDSENETYRPDRKRDIKHAAKKYSSSRDIENETVDMNVWSTPVNTVVESFQKLKPQERKEAQLHINTPPEIDPKDMSDGKTEAVAMDFLDNYLDKYLSTFNKEKLMEITNGLLGSDHTFINNIIQEGNLLESRYGAD